MDASQFRKAAHSALEDIIEQYENVMEYPVLPPVQSRSQWPATAPITSDKGSTIRSDLLATVVPNAMRWESPKFMASNSSGVEYPVVLGELYAAAFTAPGLDWSYSDKLDQTVIDWLAEAMELPLEFRDGSESAGGGVIHGSKSESIITCMIAARERYLNDRCDEEGWHRGSRGREERKTYLRTRLVALSSGADYNPTKIGAHIIGTQHRSIPVTFFDNLSVTARGLEKTLNLCQSEGLEPYFITLAFGTASTGSVDDLVGTKPVLQANSRIWVHVDAAHAGAVLVCREYLHEYSDWFDMADSFNLSPQKWLLINFDASFTFLKVYEDLSRAIPSGDADDSGPVESTLCAEFRDWQMSVGRRSPALTLWLVMRTYGIAGIQEHIRNVMWLGNFFAALFRSRADLFELVVPPAFALTCFRVRVPNTRTEPISAFSSDSSDTCSTWDEEVREEQTNAITRQVLSTINQQGIYFFAGSSVAGKDFIRAVSGTTTHTDKETAQNRIRDAFRVIVNTATEVLTATCGDLGVTRNPVPDHEGIGG